MTTPAQNLPTKPQTDDIRAIVASYKDQFKKALPKHLPPDRFIRIALTALTKTPKLMNCTVSSLMTCLLDLSQLGLEADGRKAHLIPYGTECKVVIDYKGYVDLAYRSSMIANIHADVVCENDKFEYQHGTESFLTHRPALGERGAVIAAYAVVKLKDGGSPFEVMSASEVLAIRDRSQGWKAYKSGAVKSSTWQTDESEMMKKTAFRRLSKWLPLTAEFMEAIEKDFDAPDFNDRPVIDTESLMPREIGAPQQAAPSANVISEGQAADFRAYVTGNGYKVEEVEKILGKPIYQLTKDEHEAAISKFPEKPRAAR